jgi:hypothetical protein
MMAMGVKGKLLAGAETFASATMYILFQQTYFDHNFSLSEIQFSEKETFQNISYFESARSDGLETFHL